MKVAIIGAGYVGLSNAVLLAQYNMVYAFDISQKRVDIINKKQYPIEDIDIKNYLKDKRINIKATTDAAQACHNASFILISTPTNYNYKTNSLDTSSIESAIELSIKYNPNATIVIRSTVPIGYIREMNDFDVLISDNALEVFYMVQSDLGYSIHCKEREIELREKHHHFAPLVKDKYRLEIHHQLIHQGETFTLNCVDIIRNSYCSNHEIIIPRIEENLIILCWHLYQHEVHSAVNKLIFQADIYNLLLKYKEIINWKRFFDLVRQFKKGILNSKIFNVINK